jgi:hypothetical protein
MITRVRGLSLNYLPKRKWFITIIFTLWFCFQVGSYVVCAFVGNTITDLFPGVGLDKSATFTPLNPAAYSSIETLNIQKEQLPIILFPRRGNQMPRLRSSEEGNTPRIQSSPVFSFPSGFTFPVYLDVSDWQAVQVARELMEFPSFWEISQQDQTRFLNLFADVIERVPFTLTGKGLAIIASDRYAFKFEQFIESSVIFTRDATYRFLTETGSTYSFSIGRFLGGQRLPLALGLTVKHISKNRDLIILDVSQGITEFIGTGDGIGFDLAALIKVSNSSNFGVVVENVGTWLNWNGVELDQSGVGHAYCKTDKESPIYRIGFSDVSESRMLAADLEVQPDAMATNAASRICLTYGTRLINEKVALTLSGSSDIKRRLVFSGSIGYEYGEGRIGLQLGSADFFKDSVVLGCIISREF